MRAVIQRVVQLGVVLLLVTMFTALLIGLVPGDVTATLAPVSTPVQQQQLRHELHLDRPIWDRYGEWVNGLVHGDLGCYYGTSGYTSAKTCPDKVADRVKDAPPHLVAVDVLRAGARAHHRHPARRRHRVPSRLALRQGRQHRRVRLLAIPNFVLALVLAYYVGVKLGWVAPTGYVDFGQSPVDHFKQVALPTISLAVGQVAVYMRLLRSDMIATLQEDFVTMARAKGSARRASCGDTRCDHRA